MNNYMPSELISIIIPAYNEEESIQQVIAELTAHTSSLNIEIIVIDDGSIDKTREIVEQLENVNLIVHTKNKGKGKALQNGFEHATGEFLVIQDADMEYHPRDIPFLVDPLLRGEADVVYGSRFASGDIKTMSYSHRFGNWLLTLFTRILYGFKTTDMETGYKAFRRDLIQNVEITANSFNIEPELTAIFSKRKAKFVEIPISYSYREKGDAKISWVDGVVALWWLFKLKFRRYR